MSLVLSVAVNGLLSANVWMCIVWLAAK